MITEQSRLLMSSVQMSSGFSECDSKSWTAMAGVSRMASTKSAGRSLLTRMRTRPPTSRSATMRATTSAARTRTCVSAAHSPPPPPPQNISSSTSTPFHSHINK